MQDDYERRKQGALTQLRGLLEENLSGTSSKPSVIDSSKLSEARASQTSDTPEGRSPEQAARVGRMNEALLHERSEHRKTRSSLQKSEEDYRELVENANIIILRLDTQGNITFFNRFARKFFGYTQEEILGRSMIGAIMPETESSERDLDKMIRDVLKQPEQYLRKETENKLRTEERVWISWVIRGLVDDRGRVEAILCIGNDISDRKRAEEVLRQDESRLQSLLELSQMRDVSIRKISDFVLEKLVELTKSEVGWLGFMEGGEETLTLHVLLRGSEGFCNLSDKPSHFPVENTVTWAQASKDRRVVLINDCTSSLVHEKGFREEPVPLSRFMSIPIFDGDAVVALAAVANKSEDYDASDSRQLTLLMDGIWKLVQRDQSLRALREAEYLSAMGRSLAGVAHDMKTPLVAIGGFSRLVRGHLEKESPDRRMLDIVIAETLRMESMVKEMLHFARPLELKMSMENINRVIKESLSVVEPAARERGVRILSRTSPDIAPVAIDVMRMKQVIINLAMNAVQASPEGATVVVSSYRRGTNLIVDTIDRGSGIPPERREEIFYPFVSTKKHGTGLGLSIVKKIIDAHGGEVRIVDNPEGGIIFRVLIPCP